MKQLSPELQKKYDELKKQYASKFSDKFHLISEFKNKLSNGEVTIENIESLYQIIHSLAGSSALFGFAEIGELAHKAELTLKKSAKQKVLPTENEIKETILRVSELEREVSCLINT